MADKIPLVFYRTHTGNEPVREWPKELPEDDRRAIGRDFQRVQYRWPVGMPFARTLTKGLWELRTDLSGNRIARMIFCFHEEELVVLNGFIKKTRKAPKAEIDLALDRMREMTR